MNEHLARRDRRRERALRQAGAHRENQVALGEEVHRHRGLRVAARPRGELVAFIERALAHEGIHHRSAQQLGELLEFLRGLCIQDAVACPDQRQLRPEQQVGCLAHGTEVRRGADPRHPAIGEFARVDAVRDILRDVHHGGLRASGAKRLEGLAQPVRDLFGRPRGGRVLRDELVVRLIHERRVLAELLARGRARQVQGGRAVREGMRDPGEGILGAGQFLDRADADLGAVRGARDAIGHVAGHALLAGEDQADAGARDCFCNRAGREEEHLLHAFALEHLGQRVCAGHRSGWMGAGGRRVRARASSCIHVHAPCPPGATGSRTRRCVAPPGGMEYTSARSPSIRIGVE